MITDDQATEIKRLANLMAISRVRQFAVARGVAGPNETVTNAEKRVDNAKSAFGNYLAEITTKPPKV